MVEVVLQWRDFRCVKFQNHENDSLARAHIIKVKRHVNPMDKAHKFP